MNIATTCRAPLARFLAVLVLGLLPVAAGATPWNETGDAGESIPGAQITAGPNPLTSINGTIDTMNDRDLYCIRIVDRVAFLASLLCAGFSDPDLYLFASTGIGLSHNDACSAASTRVTGAFVGLPGAYYLGVSWDGSSANNGIGNPIWNPPHVSGERAPDGTGAPGPLAGWAAQPVVVTSHAYTVTLAGCMPCDNAVGSSGRAWGSLKILYR